MERRVSMMWVHGRGAIPALVVRTEVPMEPCRVGEDAQWSRKGSAAWQSLGLGPCPFRGAYLCFHKDGSGSTKLCAPPFSALRIW